MSVQPQFWLAEPLSGEAQRSIDLLAAHPDVRQLAVMPDAHFSRDVCVGLAVATERTIFPAAVGGDIGCGMAAIATDGDAGALNSASADELLRQLRRRVPPLLQRRDRRLKALPAPLLQAPLSHPCLEKLKVRDALWQLGTLGRGNHFLEFQADAENRLWLMLHSGSRAAGQAITAHHLRGASRQGRLAALDAESAAGRNYLADAAWAVRYAAESRMAMLHAAATAVRDLFGFQLAPETLIHTDHNHVRQELHDGRLLWVHRKGAQQLAAGESGVVPGSMGASSFHVTGRGCPRALHTTSHGAGRRLSRKAARQQIRSRDLRRQLRNVWHDERAAHRLTEEAPAAYKDIRAVIHSQRELLRVERELRPLLSYKC